MKRELRSFSGDTGFTLRRKLVLVIWFALQHIAFKSALFPASLRPSVLKLFGASIGKDVLIRRGVRVHFPWNLEIGDNCWIGEEVWFLNHNRIEIASNVCISQRAIICASGHDFRSISLEYAHKPIKIKDGAWICLDSKVLPGVSIGECSVVSAGEVARKSLPDYSMLVGGQVRPIDRPK